MASSSLLRVQTITTAPQHQLNKRLSLHHHRLLPTKLTCSSSPLLLPPWSSKPATSDSLLWPHRGRVPAPVRVCTQAEAAGSEEQVKEVTQIAEEDDGFEAKVKKVSSFGDACWRFLRPHTLYGTAMASISLAARAWIQNTYLMKWSLLFKALFGFGALLCANSYIVGINQIYDVEIDKVNKPYLPIAAGDISEKTGWGMVIAFGMGGLMLVGLNSSGAFLTCLYCFALLLGTIYSIPPFRLKRFPFASFLMIATVRGFLVNFGVYYASRSVLGLAFEWSSPVTFITIFVTLFALVIAITKDLPDVEGDRKFKISTFATKLGVRNIAFLGAGLLILNYIAAVFAAIYMPQVFNRSVLIPTHTIMALALMFQTWRLEQAKYKQEAISEFYQFLWKLFYVEYIVFPFI